MQLLSVIIGFLILSTSVNDGNIFPIKDKSKADHFKKHYAKVPKGEFLYNGEKVIIASDYYMFKTEVTNLNYKEFIISLKETGKLKDVIKKVELGKNDKKPFKGNVYFENDVYESYPVVNVSKESAVLYCKWLETKLIENFDLKAHEIEVRLPTKQEWIYAAKATKSGNVYSWDGSFLRNDDGQVLVNFNLNLSQEDISFDPKTNSYTVIVDPSEDNSTLMAPSISYLPNGLGLYNMCGNVSEFVNENESIAMGGSYMSAGYDIRTESESLVNKSNGETGFRPIVIFK